MSKLYVWALQHLSDKQLGIQTTHVVTELVDEYMVGEQSGARSEKKNELLLWLSNPTIVLFKSNSSEHLSKIYDFFCNMPGDDTYPIAYFNESDINDATVAVAIVLDSSWDKMARNQMENPNDWEKQLLVLLNTSVTA